MTNFTRRGAMALGGALLSAPALAQLPNRPIRMLIPWAPGGTTDVQMRALCEAASRRLGVSVVPENKPGAAGILGAQQLLNERPDGTVLAQMPISVFRNPSMMARPPFNPITDFSYVIHLTGYLFGVVVKADAPWNSFQAFLDHAKANPGSINYGSPGVASSLHITMERIAQMKGIDWTHVPFRGVAENMQALLGGQIHATADSSGWSQLVVDGQLKLLVTWGEQRAKRFPDVPTLREAGIDIVSASPYGIAGPKNMDPGLVRALHDGFKEALHDPSHLAVLDRYDMPVMYKDPAAYAAYVRQTVEEEKAMVERMGLRIN